MHVHGGVAIAIAIGKLASFTGGEPIELLASKICVFFFLVFLFLCCLFILDVGRSCMCNVFVQRYLLSFSFRFGPQDEDS